MHACVAAADALQLSQLLSTVAALNCINVSFPTTAFVLNSSKHDTCVEYFMMFLINTVGSHRWPPWCPVKPISGRKHWEFSEKKSQTTAKHSA
jgi:hypothetical protein